MPVSVIQSKDNDHNKSVVTPKMLKNYLDLNLLHPEFTKKESAVPDEVLKALGVGNLTLQQLVDVLKRQIMQVQQIFIYKSF